jgi:hypothetical protein
MRSTSTLKNLPALGANRRSMGSLLAVLAVATCGGDDAATDQAATDQAQLVPAFQVDEAWPQLPADWVMASGLGLYVDAGDHVWVSHRAELVEPEHLEAAAQTPARAAPIVMELDASGQVVQGWEGDLPGVLHGFFVDHNDFVWTTARDQHQIMKFTRDGELVLTIGRENETAGSNDTELMGRPSDIYVAPETNEVFVVDGYTNRRVVVFDGETGAYLRHWGAYGERPDDEVRRGPPESVEDAPEQFNLVHAIAGSDDGLIYVADRSNSRIQVFTRAGDYVQERLLRAGSGGAFAVAFSHDPEQQFVFVADGTEHKVWILRRSDLEILGSFGSEGAAPGQFQRPHNLAVDSRGNIYVAEADPGWRVQRFMLQAAESR